MRTAPLLLALSLLTPQAVSQTDAEGEEVQPPQVYRAHLGKRAPDFVLRDLDGEEFRLSDHKGKVVVLEWFNPECPMVKKSHGPTGGLHVVPSRAQEQGAVWVAINSAEPGHTSADPEKTAKAAKERGMNYPVLMDPSGYVGRMYDAQSTPHLFVISPGGLIAYSGAPDNSAETDAPPTNHIEDILIDLEESGERFRPRSSIPFGCAVKYSTKAKVGVVAPDFTLRDVGGQEVSLGHYRGRVVVLEWFDPDCPEVARAHAEDGTLRGLSREYFPKGVGWIAVNSSDRDAPGYGPARNKEAAHAWQLRHPILMDGDGAVARTYGAATAPQVFILDRFGVLRYAGAHDDRKGTSYVPAALDAILAGEEPERTKTRNYGCPIR